MPSIALKHWRSRSSRVLDEIQAAHAAVGGTGAGRRFAAQQVNQACVVALCSQFQRFCRDLHTECVNFLTDASVRHDPRLSMLRKALIEGRRLDTGNPNPGNLGSDFGRLQISFWDALRLRDPETPRLQGELDELCAVRNAVAHQDFRAPRFGGRQTVRLADVRRWRRACDALATLFDAVAADEIATIMGSRPWQ